MKKLVLAFVFLITAQLVFGSSTPMPLFDYLEQDKPLEVIIKTDFSAIIDNKLTSKSYQPGIFSFEGKDGKKREIPLKVKARGKFRRQNCDFPPLKLKFKKTDLALMGLDTFNTFKLVTHCSGDELTGESYLKKEFLAYQMMNQFMDMSFRTQLLKIKYIDSNGNKSTLKTYAFLIEDDEQLANRMNGKVVKSFNTSPERVDKVQLTKIALFNYLIGNSDWNLRMSKNLKFIKQQNGQLCPIAYDFDFSSFVNPPYIKHGEYILKEIYLSPSELIDIKSEVLDKKEDFFQIIKEFQYASATEKRKMRKCIEIGFEKLEAITFSDKNGASAK